MGSLYYNTERRFIMFPLWKPNVWNTFCVIADATNKIYKTIINEETVFESHQYDGYHKKSMGNIKLLNGFSHTEDLFFFPFKGEVTDVNIWNKTIGVTELGKWSKCENREPGNIIDWMMADLDFNETKIEVKEVEEEEVCFEGHITSTKAFRNQLDFQQSIMFCDNLGGEVAIAKDMNHFREMVIEISNLGHDTKKIYSGYWNKDEMDDQWKDVNNGEPLNWGTWAPDQTYNECATINVEDNIGKSENMVTFRRDHCLSKTYPICKFNNWPPELQLRGIPIAMTQEIDSGYYLINSSLLIGKSKSKIVFDKENWSILD